MIIYDATYNYIPHIITYVYNVQAIYVCVIQMYKTILCYRICSVNMYEYARAYVCVCGGGRGGAYVRMQLYYLIKNCFSIIY